MPEKNPATRPAHAGRTRTGELAPDQATASRLRRLATWCGGLVVSLAILCLLGWWIGIRFFTRIHPQYIPIASSTALALLIQGAILILEVRGSWRGKGRRLAGLAIVSFTLVYGLLTAIKYFIGVDLTFEQVTFPASEPFGVVMTNRMSPITGTLLGLSSLSLFFMLRPAPGRIARHLPGIWGGLVVMGSFVVIMGYLFGTPVLYGSGIIPVAAMTAVGFMLLGVGLTAAAGPDCFPLRALVGPSTRARLLRAFLPVTVGAVLCQGLLHVVLPRLVGQVSPAIMTALLALAFGAVTGLVVALAGRSIGEDLDRARGALLDSEAKYRRLMERAYDAILIADADTGIIVDANQRAEELWGLPKDRLIGLHQSQLHPPEDRERSRREFQKRAITAGLSTDEVIVNADGRLIPVEISAAAIQVGDKTLIQGIFRDVSERRQAEAELRAAAQKWQTTFDAIGAGVCLIGEDLKIIQCNQAMAKLVAKPLPEILGRTCWELLLGASEPSEECPCVRMLQSRRRETLTLPRGERWLYAVVDPILNEAGKVSGAVYIISDITDYKLAEAKIKNLYILLQAIKDINEALLRAQSESELFQETCNLLLRVPYIKFSWIGLVQPDRQEVKPVAWAGAEAGYLEIIQGRWDEAAYGDNPTRKAINTATPLVRQSIETDPAPNPWRQAALERGYQSSITLPLIHKGEVIGVLKGYAGVAEAFGVEEVEFLNQVASDIAVGIRSLRLAQGLQQGLRQLRAMMGQTVEAIASMAEMRDPYTAGHQRGVTLLACALAAELGLDEDRIEGIRVSGFLHDIGKMVVPAEILNKPGKLSKFEFEIIRTHSQAGYDILEKIDFPWPVAQTVLQHHERLDGSGYPQGLIGADILLEAKILAVADVVEAMAAHRPYRPALGLDRALEEITKNRGSLYDPEVVDACLKICREKRVEISSPVESGFPPQAAVWGRG